ncbi:MAG: hypothetical protein LQ345_006672 [Seirophora villosa]|nr:MAG: hypothetical protein LQ345_006672 [Seirophora villosa]
MATTTLTTFLLHLPSSVRTVDLLGSWDNFQQAYPLQRDRQAGPGHWRGCHTFKNIICDGHHLDPSVSRNGALKMGGTYWYFYRLDGDSEQHDSDEPSTTTCPLLPGQQVNVLDVPTQQQDEEHRPCTLLESTVFTMDPKAKYSPLKPPVRQDAIQQPNLSDPTAVVAPAPGDGKLQRLFSSTTSALSTADLQPLRRTRANTSQGPCITLPKGSALMAMFHKIRGARSAPSSTNPRGSERSTPSRPPEQQPGEGPFEHAGMAIGAQSDSSIHGRPFDQAAFFNAYTITCLESLPKPYSQSLDVARRELRCF